MPSSSENLVQKVHPVTREMLPEDPLDLHGIEVPGDPDLMLRLLVEEYSRMGAGVEVIMQLARDPFYQAFHGLQRHFGDDELYRRVNEIIKRSGVVRVKTVETTPLSEQLVQINMPEHDS
jgi:hypothetical protein